MNTSTNRGGSVIPRAVTFAVIVLVVIAGLEVVLADHDPSIHHVVSLAVATLGPTLPVIVLKELRENPFHLLSYYYFNTVIGVTLGAFVIHLDLIPHDRPESIFAETCYVAGISFFLVSVGYVLPLGKWLADRLPLFLFPNEKEREPDLGWGPYLTGLFMLYGLGWLGRIIRGIVGVFHMGGSEAGGALTRFNFLWTLLPNLSKFSFIMIVGLWLSRKLPNRFPAALPVILVVLEVFAGLYLGSRSRMIFPLIMVLIAYHYVRSTVSWRILVVGAVSLIFFVLPLTTLFRTHYFKQLETGKQGVDQVVSSAGETFRRSDDQFERAFTPTLTRLTVYFPALSRVLNRVPERYSFQHGATYLEGMIMGVVPRVIYPNKGQYNPGSRFAYLFFDHHEETDTNTGITTAGELYFNHGYVGLVGMVLIGILFRLLWERFRYQARTEFMPLYRVHYLLFSVSGVTVLAFYLPGLIRISLMYYLGLICLHRRLPRMVMPRQL